MTHPPQGSEGLVESLRAPDCLMVTRAQAADRIEALEAENERLKREAIEREDALRDRALERTVRAQALQQKLEEAMGATERLAHEIRDYTHDEDILDALEALESTLSKLEEKET